MTTRSERWTRRQFTQVLAASAAASLVRGAHASNGAASHFAFVGAGAEDGSVQVFHVAGMRWTAAASVASMAPVRMVMHPSLPVLYVVHGVRRWQNLPRGAVSAYAFDAHSGKLTLMNTQPLSLSATNPRDAVVMPGGKSLFVAAEQGGIYNVLPVSSDGALQPVATIRKEYGCGEAEKAKAASPCGAALHPDGSIFTADAGQETISRFTLRKTGLAVEHRTRVHAGSGPSQLVLLAAGTHACAMNADNGSVSLHRITAAGLSSALQTIDGSGPGELAQHPSGRFLIMAGADRTGVLDADHRFAELSGSSVAGLRSPRFTPDGSALAALRDDRVTLQPFDANNGTLGAACSVARIENARSLLLHPA